MWGAYSSPLIVGSGLGCISICIACSCVWHTCSTCCACLIAGWRVNNDQVVLCDIVWDGRAQSATWEGCTRGLVAGQIGATAAQYLTWWPDTRNQVEEILIQGNSDGLPVIVRWLSVQADRSNCSVLPSLQEIRSKIFNSIIFLFLDAFPTVVFLFYRRLFSNFVDFYLSCWLLSIILDFCCLS